ncbi:NADPH oxidase regulator NoxR [Mycena kentingensis (nom. inval.)]|nr:NADPH oxidase regulator NoxR [Mycena kentingensis (nom. inval.)]
MSTTLKDQLVLWAAAKDAVASNDLQAALSHFRKMEPSAIISNNIGLVYTALGRHERALRHFADAQTRDNYLTIAYFQRGVSHFLLERYRPAGRDFKRAWLSLRGMDEINYELLGLPFRLFASEVLFNLGLSRIRLGRMENGLEYLEKAKRLTMTEDHDVIEEVIARKGDGFTVFSIPPGVLYWPAEKKLKGVQQRNYMGSAILVAATDPDDLTTDFIGPQLAAARRHKTSDAALQARPSHPMQRNLNRKSAAILAWRVTNSRDGNEELEFAARPGRVDGRSSSDEEYLSDVPRHVDADVRLP